MKDRAVDKVVQFVEPFQNAVNLSATRKLNSHPLLRIFPKVETQIASGLGSGHLTINNLPRTFEGLLWVGDAIIKTGESGYSIAGHVMCTLGIRQSNK